MATTDKRSVPYPHPRDARVDYPYAAVLVEPTGDLEPPASWNWARSLDSGEVEVLYDGAGTVERLPGSVVKLRTPPEQRGTTNPDSAEAWDKFLENATQTEE